VYIDNRMNKYLQIADTINNTIRPQKVLKKTRISLMQYTGPSTFVTQQYKLERHSK